MKIQCLHSEIPESTCMISLHGFKTSFNTSVTAVPLLLPAKHFHGFSKVSDSYKLQSMQVTQIS